MNKARVGFTCSAFDLLHAGHVLMLEEAKKQCDYLVVGLQVDPSVDRPDKNSPIQSLTEREIQLQAIRYIDEIHVYETEAELLQLIKAVSPDIRIVGEDYLGKDFTGKEWCLDSGVEIYYNSRNHPYSTTELRKRILSQDSE